MKMDNQQPRPKGKAQRLISPKLLGIGYKCLVSEVVRVRKDEDIVWSLVKTKGL
jgi:hypothetical protein|nr:MAG TPA: hypothetical protein [Caudoviricetes sp.]